VGEVELRVRDVDLLGERSRDGGLEAERPAVLAHVRAVGVTPRARPVREVERDGHLVALLDVLDLRPGLDDRPRRFVPQYLVGRRRPVAVPGVPVAPADATGIHVHDHPFIGRLGFLAVLDDERLTVLLENCCAHGSFAFDRGCNIR